MPYMDLSSMLVTFKILYNERHSDDKVNSPVEVNMIRCYYYLYCDEWDIQGIERIAIFIKSTSQLEIESKIVNKLKQAKIV